MEKLKNFIDNYLHINKEITLAVFTIEHDNKNDINHFIKSLSSILVFDSYNISRKGTKFSILTTVILTIKGKHSTEEINNYITLLFNHVSPIKKENIFLLHRDVYADDINVTHPLAQMQISYGVLIVKEHLKLTNVL